MTWAARGMVWLRREDLSPFGFVVECTHVDEDDGVIAKVEERG